MDAWSKERESKSYAKVMDDTQSLLKKGECAKSMGPRSNAPRKREECAKSMGQKSNDAAVRDAQVKLGRA